MNNMRRVWYETAAGDLECTWIPEPYKVKQEKLKKMIEETLISIREEFLIRTDIPMLISLGIDPLVYTAHEFHNKQGYALIEKWWGTWVYHIIEGKLVNLFDRNLFPKFCGRVEAASPSPWKKNLMV